jgi:hypothetical protein
MKIRYSNSFGKFIQTDFMITEVTAEVNDHEHSTALDQGFLVRSGVWRQCRSTRTRLIHTDYKILDSAKIMIDYDYDELLKINECFLQYKNFTLAPHDIMIGSDHMIWGYWNNDQLVAWSKIYQYQGELETAYFAWDYQQPKLHLGIRSLEHEIAWAKNLGYKYMYLGPGYESCSVYKSKVAGFEWWTGSEWSQDVEHYAWLCDRETTVENFKQYELAVYNATQPR